MIAYVSLMLLTIATAFVAVRIYRMFSGSGMMMQMSTAQEKKVVALSSTDGQWRLRQQKGFVRPDRRAPRRVVAKRVFAKSGNTTSNPNIRTPWGW